MTSPLNPQQAEWQRLIKESRELRERVSAALQHASYVRGRIDEALERSRALDRRLRERRWR